MRRLASPYAAVDRTLQCVYNARPYHLSWVEHLISGDCRALSQQRAELELPIKKGEL